MCGVEEDVQVCKKMFLRTLGWHSDGALRLQQRWSRDAVAHGSGLQRVDNRAPASAIDHGPITH